jgi:prepilin signal peptidase PulO-like enzyme (type II secretory pathway)
MEIAIKIILFVAVYFLGAALSSFSLVIVRRGHNNDWKSWLTGKSMCESCKKELKWYELIPTISFLALRGKCSGCKTKIDPSHFLTETFGGIMYLLTFAIYTIGYCDLYTMLFLMITHTFMTALSASDFLYREINVIPVYVLAGIGMLYNVIIRDTYMFSIISIAAFIVFGILFMSDNFASFGSGDVDVIVCLLAITASWFGLIDIILYASLCGIILNFTIYRKTNLGIPFVPCLYFGFILHLIGISFSTTLYDLCQTMMSM